MKCKMIALLLCLVCQLQVVRAQRQISLQPDTKFQTIEFFGAADAWSGHFVGKYWSQEVKDQIADYLFSQEVDEGGNPIGIGLSIWRVNLGAGTLEQSGADIYPIQRRAESYMTLDGKGYDWGKCSGQEYFMQAAKERGCNDFILFSNSPLVQYTINGKGYSPYDNSANIREDCYDDYARYLADVAKHLIEKGYKIPYISPINEPQGNWNSPRQEGSPWRNSQMFKMIKALDTALSGSEKTDNVRIFIAESARLQVLYEHRPSHLKRFNGDTLECPGRQLYTFFDKSSPYYIGDLRHINGEFTAHVYHNHYSSNELREVHRLAGAEAAKYGLDYHSSEWCLLPSDRQYEGMTDDWIPGNHADMQAALMMARLIHSDFTDANAVSWCYWKGMELNGDHALLALHAKDGDIHKGGYVSANKILWTLGNFSRFIRPGYVRICLEGADDLDAIAGTAFMSSDHSRIVAVFVNSSFKKEDIIINLPKVWKRKLSSVRCYSTDGHKDLAVSDEGLSLSHTIAPRSVVTVIMDF